MNDEIKEIISKRKQKIELNKSLNVQGYYDKEDELLLDYINNLQQENERLKELDENYPIEEELAEAYRREEDYTSRIDKAIEYINNLSKEPNVFGHYGIHNDCAKWLLKLLRGEDK